MLKDDPDILFVFVGDGAGKQMLYDKVKELNLENVRFIGYQPRELMPDIFATADASLGD